MDNITVLENWLLDRGYEVINESRPYPWVKILYSLEDIEPLYVLIDEDGETIASWTECSYEDALGFAKDRVENE